MIVDILRNEEAEGEDEEVSVKLLDNFDFLFSIEGSFADFLTSNEVSLTNVIVDSTRENKVSAFGLFLSSPTL